MIDPLYQVKVDGKTYFLWIDQDYGIIMDSEDTHTIYSLSNESTLKILEFVEQISTELNERSVLGAFFYSN